MAYTSNESGAQEIYVRPFPASTSKWKVSTSGGTEPRWRADGKELFYLSGGKLMTVQVRTSPSFHTSLPTTLFDGRPSGNSEWSYDVAPDGQSFVFTVSSGNTAPPRIDVVLNWPAALSSPNR
jgi:Tol biopolymer transport system component